MSKDHDGCDENPISSLQSKLSADLQRVILNVQKLRVDAKEVVTEADCLLHERLCLEQKLEDMKVCYGKKVEEYVYNQKRNSHVSCTSPLDQLSSVSSAVFQDVKLLRQQFRQIQEQVDSLNSNAEMIEKKEQSMKQLDDLIKTKEKNFEDMAKLLQENIVGLVEDQAILEESVQKAYETNNYLQQQRIKIETVSMNLVNEIEDFGNNLWLNEYVNVITKSSEIEKAPSLENTLALSAEKSIEELSREEKLEFKLQEKMSELKSVSQCVESSLQTLVEFKKCSEEEAEYLMKNELVLEGLKKKLNDLKNN